MSKGMYCYGQVTSPYEEDTELHVDTQVYIQKAPRALIGPLHAHLTSNGFLTITSIHIADV